MLNKKLQKTLIMSAARQLRDTFLTGSRATPLKGSALDELMGMLTVVGFVFGIESPLYKAIEAIWKEINETPLACGS